LNLPASTGAASRPPHTGGNPYRVSFVIVPGFSMTALSAALEPLRSANRLQREERYAWAVVARTPGAVTASNGLDVAAPATLDDVPAADLTVVVASSGIESYRDRGLFARLRALRRQHRLIGAVSNGALLLARAGLLEGRRATIHWEMREQLAQEFPGINLRDTLHCWDSDIMTSAGGTAAMDMMLELIARRDGRRVAEAVAEQFLHHPSRMPSAPQRQRVRWRYGVTDRRVAAAIRLMEDRIARPLRIARVAESAGLSERQLERLFRSSFGKSPSRFYMDLRLRTAQARLLGTTDSLEEIAEAMGFSSQAHFSHAIKVWSGLSPLTIRKGRRGRSVGSLKK
jgi:transcriptional regulator GlxA family with amidase domain